MKFLRNFLTGAYFIILIYLVFFAERRRHLNKRLLNIVPFKNTFSEFLKINYHQRREITSFYSNVLGNVALFIPFSLILISFNKKIGSKKILLYAMFLSISIETIQYVFCIGVADIDDVLLNVTGAAAGVLLFKLYKTVPSDGMQQLGKI